MLELEVVPERSLSNEYWEVVLGMTFSHVVQSIQQQINRIKNVQVLYNEKNPLKADLVIKMCEDGIQLRFDPVSQRLKIIEVNNLNKVKLKYCSIVFCSPEIPPTIEQIDHTFGATHPGEYDASHQLFILSFRGLSFSFPVDPRFQPNYTQGMESFHFPLGTSPTVAKMCIYSGNNLAETKPPSLPLSNFYNHCYLDKLEVLREKNKTVGVKLHLISEALGSNKLRELRKQTVTKVLSLGDTVQDVCSAIGSPNKVFYKADDKMKIHLPNSHKLITYSSSDYFYNFFTLGMDILFDARIHRVKKFILHTNYPGHYDFNIYLRCNLSIDINCTNKENKSETLTITTFTKWDSVKHKLIKLSVLPVVLNRTSTNTTNPFGSTFSFGFEDMIFEVMPNNHIASVTLYQKPIYSQETI
ncbi:phagosome assembly factor 1-like [Centruroides vittatus]|uniref:phagosome assembly factor 1-like n=1 Tax=Centruroides vittatus TaxID=120091 RepID=UPI0035104844